jgi:predicted nucleic acid-binding Zn ribbon protein
VAHELRALSTFAKAAALRGGLAAAAALSQCHGIGAGRAPARVARPGPGACSSECQGLETVYSP